MAFRNDYTHTFNVENELASVVNNGSTTSFTYDAAGIRVKTVRPGGRTSYYPFPGYEEEVNGSTITRRITYSMAGQAVALRVQIVSGSNTLYYLHTDHLGSTSLATTTGGAVVAGSTARYYPFGDWRTEPTAGLTDRGFTGHLHNNLGSAPDDIGLVYMQARWYLPGLARFISADSIIPNPANPQSYNRYAYVENRPLNFSDPTGHCGGDSTESLINQCVTLRDWLQSRYGISIEGIWLLMELMSLKAAFGDIEGGFHDLGHVQVVYRGTTISRLRESGQSEVSFPMNLVKVRNGTFTQKSGSAAAHFVLLHELMHRFDARHNLDLSEQYESDTDGHTVAIIGGDCPVELATIAGVCEYRPGPDVVSRYAETNRREDFADSAAAYLYNGGSVSGITGNQTNHGLFGALSVDRGQAVQSTIDRSYDIFNLSGGGKGTHGLVQ